MGHITVDRIEHAWKKLKKAKHLAENEQTHAAVLECENALQELFKSADGMDYGPWFTGKEDSVRNTIGHLKTETEPEKENVTQLITNCEEILYETKDKVIPELHSRIDYEPTPTLRKD